MAHGLLQFTRTIKDYYRYYDITHIELSRIITDLTIKELIIYWLLDKNYQERSYDDDVVDNHYLQVVAGGWTRTIKDYYRS